MLFCLDLWVNLLHLAATGRKLPVLCFFHPSFFFLTCIIVCHFSSPSLPHIYRNYSGICPQGVAAGAERCKVHFCPPVKACMGPGGAPAETTRTPLLSRHIPFCEGYGMEDVMWGWLKTDGSQSQNCGWVRLQRWPPLSCPLVVSHPAP